jgi:hypothetical protein
MGMRKLKRSRQRASKRRRIGRVLAAASVVAGAGAVGAAPATAEDPTNWQSNICGADGCKICLSGVCFGYHRGNTAALDNLKARVNSYSSIPLTVGLQESCGRQFEDFKTFLRGKNSGYWGAIHNQATQTDYCSSSENMFYGVSAYAFGGVNPYDYSATMINIGAFTNQGVNDVGLPDEQRGSACIRGDLFGTPYWSCSAHMTGDTTKLDEQMSEYWNKVGWYALVLNTRVWWGGDLYIEPSYMPSYAANGFSLTSNAREADRCVSNTSSFNWTFNGSSSTDPKFDYSLRSGPGTGLCSVDATLTPSSASSMYPTVPAVSDHRVIGGYQPW